MITPAAARLMIGCSQSIQFQTLDEFVNWLRQGLAKIEGRLDT